MDEVTAARTLWEMYLREIRPLVWMKAELYALSKPYPALSEDGRVVVYDRRMLVLFQDRIAAIDRELAEIRRQYGIEMKPAHPPVPIECDSEPSTTPVLQGET